MDEIPVTVLCGPLGAGKTTLLNTLLRRADRDVAVLVNDMGVVNVDADLVESADDVAVDGGVKELSNGCICCELQDDLESAVTRLAREREFDHLVVEASGISEPEPVARLFTTDSRAAALYAVDAAVAVVDTRRFVDAFAGEGTPERRGPDDEGERPLSDLLVEQVEFADVVLLNKADLCSERELEEAEALVSALRPGARVYRTEFSDVAVDDLLGVGLFDPTAEDRAGWAQALGEGDGDGDGHGEADGQDVGHGHAHDGHGETHDGHDHAHPDEVYGVTSFTYRRRRPVHPDRIADVLGDLPDDVVRAKGSLWVLGRDEVKLGYNQAGPSASVTATDRWIASLPEADRKLYRSNRPDLDWDEDVGDRRVELVFIGTGVDEAALTARLDDALATDEERANPPDGDPFPAEQGERVTLAAPAPRAD